MQYMLKNIHKMITLIILIPLIYSGCDKGSSNNEAISSNDLLNMMAAYSQGYSEVTIDNGSVYDTYRISIKMKNSDNSIQSNYDYYLDCSALPIKGSGSLIFNKYTNSNGVIIKGTLNYYINYNRVLTNFDYVFTGTLNYNINGKSYDFEYHYYYTNNNSAITYNGYWKIDDQYYELTSNGGISTTAKTTQPSYNPPAEKTESVCSQTIPTVTTANMSSLGDTTAIGGGNVTNDGSDTVTARGVCWSTMVNPTINDSKTNDGTGTGSFTSNLTGLIGNTLYYVRAYATNSIGTAYGNQINFYASQGLPAVTTAAIYNIKVQTATGGGEVTYDGGVSIIARGICWSTMVNPTIDNDKTTDGTTSGSFTSNMSNLVINSTYYVRAYATNSTGTAYGDQVSFTTNSTYAIGETGPAGGLVFYDKGSYSGTPSWRYLEVAAENSTTGVWGTYNNSISGADGTAIGTGYQNTIDIVNNDPLTNTAADICSVMDVGGHTDWYLPSKDELYTLYINLQVSKVGGFDRPYRHWSSTEIDNYYGRAIDFSNNGNDITYPKNTTTAVLAIRAF